MERKKSFIKRSIVKRKDDRSPEIRRDDIERLEIYLNNLMVERSDYRPRDGFSTWLDNEIRRASNELFLARRGIQVIS